MTPENLAKKFMREMHSRKMPLAECGETLTNMVTVFLASVAPTLETQQQGAVAFGEAVSGKLELLKVMRS